MRFNFNHIHEGMLFKAMKPGDVFRFPPVLGDVFVKLQGDMADGGNAVNLSESRVHTIGQEADCERLKAVLTIE